MDYWDKRKNGWHEDRDLPVGSRVEWDDEEEDYEPYQRSSRSRPPRSRKFSVNFLSKTQKQTIAAVCLFFVVLSAKYNHDGASGAVYAAFKTALARDNDYTVALSEMARGVFGGGEGKVVAVNRSGENYLLPVEGNIVGRFGKPRIQDKRPNPGIDIAASLGSKVQAPGDGVVLKVGTDIQLGRYIKLEHGNGLVSIIANLGEVKVKAGQKITKGDTIGSLGFSSAIKRPWLHWEVYNGSQTVDPESLLGNPGGKV